MPDTATRQIGGRIYIYRGANDMLGWLDREYPPSAYRKGRHGDGNIYRRDHEWTGRWIAFACCTRETDIVTSPAEGLVMITRATEIHEAA